MADDATREMPRITVPAEIDAGIRRLAKEGGQTITWHRRKAYEEYVSKHGLLQRSGRADRGVPS